MKQNNLREALRLYLFFAKIGCFTFGGGWGILAQMEQEFIDKRALITKSDLLEMVAVGKSVPGIMILNISVLFGYQTAGIAGALCRAPRLLLPPGGRAGEAPEKASGGDALRPLRRRDVLLFVGRRRRE